MLPIMVGCAHNKCKFCGLFKHLKFRELPLIQVEDEISRVVSEGGNPQNVFLGDGNAFCLPADHIVKVAESLSDSFSNLKHINMDATVRDIASKSDEELELLASLGVWNLYIGIECGLEDVLEFMNKGNTLEEAKIAINRIKNAGMTYSAHIMSGIAGAGRGEENAHALAKFFNETQPLNICNFDLGLHRSVELWDDYKEGVYKVSPASERFLEEKILIEEIVAKADMNYDAVFEAPPLRFRGTLPKDKEKLTSQFDEAHKKYSDEADLFCIWD